MAPAIKQILSRTRDNVVCEHAEIADTPLLRLRGLLGRGSLPEGHGMLIEPAPSIHSAFMRFEFDAVFLDRDLQVIKLVERIPPWRARAARHARSVLELAAGEIEHRGIQVGDVLAVDTCKAGDALAVDQSKTSAVRATPGG
ncbi:MAG: DUF192 domain-containing protein [Solirubrobacteraceae bacterium]